MSSLLQCRMRDLSSLTRAERIEWAYRNSGKTLVAIAAHVQCSQPALSLWMAGKTKKYDAELLSRFAEVCGVRLEWLRWGAGQPHPAPQPVNDLEARALNALRVMEETAPYRANAAVVMLEAASESAAEPVDSPLPRPPTT